jgi:hypothetical protein
VKNEKQIEAQGQGHVDGARCEDLQQQRRFEPRRRAERVRWRQLAGGTTAQKKKAGRKGGKTSGSS